MSNIQVFINPGITKSHHRPLGAEEDKHTLPLSSPSSMALKISPPASFPVFSPPSLPTPRRPFSATELRFARWNNANAEPFNRHRRTQEQIEHDLRLQRRYQSVTSLTQSDPNSDPPNPAAADFKSIGTPSSPSSPSIPGRRSKYSKPPPDPNPNPRNLQHPAFRKASRPRFSPKPDPENGIAITERGIAYKIKDAPFEFQYSYTETPKSKPLALREQPYLPFGPETMPRPWTGRKPLPQSKKKLPEFDSFKLPPAGKKGVKPVQSPGPFLMGSGPKYKAMTREEVLGDPLTEEEVKELVKGCLKTRRQLNMGRDGLTHNMLDNIHAHWKRRRVCKIKCKGVCTVDMDNVRQQLEEKTGGKIINSKGGVIFLFRGRNYNYRTRPRFPLMLWKPITPVYPRLIKRVPEGLTLEEATEMRKKGHQSPPICKLGKNGVYTNLVKNVKEAFEACELVHIDCKALNKNDCRKIGAKLKDLVPCVLISFEFEHILMWRGKDWMSSLPPPEDNHNKAVELIADDSPSASSCICDLKDQKSVELLSEKNLNKELVSMISHENTTLTEDVYIKEDLDLSDMETLADSPIATSHATFSGIGKSSDEGLSPEIPGHNIYLNGSSGLEEIKDLSHPSSVTLMKSDRIENNAHQDIIPANSVRCNSASRPQRKCLDGVMLLLRQAVESGRAVILHDELDANTVYERSVTLAKSAPPGPVFQHRIRKVTGQKSKKEKTENHEEQDVEIEVGATTVSEKRSNGSDSRSRKIEDFREVIPEVVVPHGSLRVDELAKLLA